MKKKSARKHIKKSSDKNIFYFRYIAISFAVVILLVSAKLVFQHVQGNNVLGASTFITDNTGDTENNLPPQNSQDQIQNRDNQGAPPPPSTFGPRVAPESSAPGEQPLAAPINAGELNNVQFQSENGNTEVNTQQKNSQLEIKNDNGQLNIHMKGQNGNEVQLQDNSLEKINEALRGSDVQIGTGSANELTIKNASVEAKTNFPLSINPSTNTLTVTTPAGVKNVAVLPAAAVKNLLQQGIINQVTTTTTATNGAELQQVTLGLLNNQPAFQVVGVDNKKLLGLFPVAINKTAYVSAENGQVVQTNESFLSSLFDLLSTQQ